MYALNLQLVGVDTGATLCGNQEILRIFQRLATLLLLHGQIALNGVPFCTKGVILCIYFVCVFHTLIQYSIAVQFLFVYVCVIVVVGEFSREICFSILYGTVYCHFSTTLFSIVFEHNNSAHTHTQKKTNTHTQKQMSFCCAAYCVFTFMYFYSCCLSLFIALIVRCTALAQEKVFKVNKPFDICICTGRGRTCLGMGA